MTSLSPAAQAILIAAFDSEQSDSFDLCSLLEYRPIVAAALRAAADQVVPAPHPQQAYDSCCDVHKAAIRKQLLNIATELETIQ